MKACATASGGVMFICEAVNRKKCVATNDNDTALQATAEE